MKLFISWSKDESKQVAQVFYDHITKVLPAVEPILSSEMPYGGPWLIQLSKDLSAANCGLVCLTKAALQSSWMLFEAGAIWKEAAQAEAKAENIRSRLWIYVIDPSNDWGTIENSLSKEPFGLFQHERATEETTKKLLKEVHGELKAGFWDENSFVKLFWPKMDTVLKSITGKRPFDLRFWDPCFQSPHVSSCSRVKIIYNDILCFRDYVDNISVRNTNLNNDRQLTDISNYKAELKKLNQIGLIKTKNPQFEITWQFLLRGEIEARDAIKGWFDKHFPSRSFTSPTVAWLTSREARNKPEEIETAHIILLGNPRTNLFIKRVLEEPENESFRIKMGTSEMEHFVPSIFDDNLFKDDDRSKLKKYGKMKGTKSGGVDLIIKDQPYDPEASRNSFVLLTRCFNPMHPFNPHNPKRSTVLVNEGQEFATRFQCLIRVPTDHKREVESPDEGGPECIWSKIY